MEKLKLDDSALAVLNVFAKKNDEGLAIETPEQVFLRVSRAAALVEAKYKFKTKVEKLVKKHQVLFSELKETKAFEKDKTVRDTSAAFYELLSSLDFVLDGPALMHAGRSNQIGSTRAFSIEDNVDSIFQTLKNCALAHHAGANSAVSFSSLRPKGDVIRSTGGKSLGPLPFIHMFDEESNSMNKWKLLAPRESFVVSVEHPDIEDILSSSHQGHLIVSITAAFMKAAEKKTVYLVRNPRTLKTAKKDAVAVLLKLCELRVPLVFSSTSYDSITADLVPITGTVVSGAINLGHMALGEQVDWERLRRRLRESVHLLDNLIDICTLPVPARSILSLMGFADLLVQLKIRYDSDKALQIAREILMFVKQDVKKAGDELGKHRGMKNRSNIAIMYSPTHFIAQATVGFAPIGSLARKHMLDETELIDVHPYFAQMLRQEGAFSESIVKKIMEQGSLKGVFIPAWIKRIFVTAREIPLDFQLRMQALVSEFCEGAVVLHAGKDVHAEEAMHLALQDFKSR